MKTDHPRGFVVYGDISIDFYIRTTYRPDAGQDAKVEKINFEAGGSAANCAAVAAKLDIPTVFIGFIGTDSFGDILQEDLKKHGVSVSNLLSIAGETGITTAIIDPAGERTFYSYRGVNASGELSQLQGNFFEDKGVLHISGYSFQDVNSRNNALYLIQEARKFATLISLDPSFWFSKEYHKENPDLLSAVNIIYPSREEAKLISGSGDPEAASQIIRGMGPEIVIITLGTEGCYLSSDEHTGYLPATPVPDVVDTTGAGDAFCGGFLAGQIKGLTTLDSAKVGSITAAKIIGQIGGHKGAPSLEELRAFLINSHEETLAQSILGG